jgi:hypothetical protein
MQRLNCKHNQTRNAFTYEPLLANISISLESWTLQSRHSNTSDLQNHKLIQSYKKCKNKSFTTDCGSRVENANIMQKKLCGL